MGDFLLDGLTDSGYNPITLHPEWDFREQERAIRSRHRTKGGLERVYDWGTFFSYSVPLQIVNSADANRINRWWEDGTTLLFTLDSSVEINTAKVEFVNETVPMNVFNRPYQDLYAGVLMLEATDASSYTRQVFTLDDAVFGLMDQTYNGLG